MSASVSNVSLPSMDDVADEAGLVDARMLAFMRCLLAVSALLIIYIDPAEPARYVELTYASLAVYCIYGVAIAVIESRHGWPKPRRLVHWIDVLFYSGLITLTEGTGSIFFHFYFFAILSASFSYGYREGLMVTAASVAAFLSLGLLSSPTGAEFELNQTLIRPVYLATLGYMVAHWGGYETVLMRRLRLLTDVNNVWSPRFGVHHVIGVNLNRLVRLHQRSSATLIVQKSAATGRFLMYGVSGQKRDETVDPREVTEDAARVLLGLPRYLAVAYHGPSRASLLAPRSCIGYDLEARARVEIRGEECEPLANLLEADSFVSVPYIQRDGATGRLYLTAAGDRFTRSDMEYLFQFATALASVVENMQLMDELVARAAEHERFKISRDIHDTTIQPYIGLKLAIDALYREAGPAGPLSQRIAALAEMAGTTIHDLRHYAETLREKTSAAGEHLSTALRELAGRYRRYYEIDVEVTCHMNSGLTDRLAAEAFQIASEGLSNVMRHTAAKRAYVAVLCEIDYLLVQIGNVRSGDSGAGEFIPRSISERAGALGGNTLVEQGADGYTVVRVSIPM